MITLLQLFWSFTKIGFTSFGGLSMIPLISSEMLAHHWMNAEEITDIVAIAEMTPGPLGLNCATFAGIRTAGIPGAVAANLGVLMPTLTITMLAAVFFERVKNGRLMQKILLGVRPACIGLVAGVVISLALSNYIKAGRASVLSIAIGAADAVLLLKFKMSIPAVIGISAVLGFLTFGVLGL